MQDGRLVGAVTHVLVANPAEGYGIFLENMADHGGISACEDREVWSIGSGPPARVYRDFLCKTIDRRGGGLILYRKGSIEAKGVADRKHSIEREKDGESDEIRILWWQAAGRHTGDAAP